MIRGIDLNKTTWVYMRMEGKVRIAFLTRTAFDATRIGFDVVESNRPGAIVASSYTTGSIVNTFPSYRSAARSSEG